MGTVLRSTRAALNDAGAGVAVIAMICDGGRYYRITRLDYRLVLTQEQCEEAFVQAMIKTTDEYGGVLAWFDDTENAIQQTEES
jgi:hypothetical protein